ncbi:hypothetical protein RNJ44_03443 [Nakaseomyces bracarensis]|uniref:Uncharacterized protein n=1 Tax=Nakaseomyces bracarensis TaxID=273131 RepID=A0ABR4NWY8_9SACH
MLDYSELIASAHRPSKAHRIDFFFFHGKKFHPGMLPGISKNLYYTILFCTILYYAILY